jgi:archaetidylserine synthase
MNIFRTLSAPDLFSLLNALFGFCAVLMALKGSIYISIMLVLFAAVADGLDGFLARRKGTSVLGANLDSLADLVSFGVAPATMAFAAFNKSSIVWASCSIFLLCGVLRLARFNITPKNNQFFEGLPITASGTVMSVSLLLDSLSMTLFLILLLSGLMVSGVPYPKVRDYRIISGVVLIVLVAVSLYRFGQGYSEKLIFLALVAYLISPVVISCLTRGRCIQKGR